MSDHKIIAFIEKIKREYNSVLANTMQCLGSGTTEFVRFWPFLYPDSGQSSKISTAIFRSIS